LEVAPFSDGRFEVFLDGRNIFSKKGAGRFPDWEDVEPEFAAAA
jgi:selT/selW/selH-like putative selenoprotein